MTLRERQSISRHTLLWLLLTNIAILSPLYQQATLWSLGICAICIIWRIGIYLGKVAKPPMFMVTALAFASAFTLAVVAPEIGVLTALINLLILGYALKYIEMRNRRDVRAVVLVGYFLIAFTFIEHQSLWSTAHLALVTIINTCVLVSLYHDNMRFKQTAGLGTKLILQSLPLTLLLFLVLPRLPPLWLVPPLNSAKTGLSSSVSFGDIGELTRSGALAFRASFETSPPPNNALYWRAIVMEDYDGKTWTRNPGIESAESQLSPSNNPLGLPSLSVDYTIIAEPSSQHWLFGLDLATSKDPNVIRLPDYRLYATRPIDQRFQYRVNSYPNIPMDPELSDPVKSINLALPEGSNPKTRALAMRFLLEYPAPEQRLKAMMGYFLKQPYFYTLRPPAVGPQQIDDFLFENQAGFCVHYASAMAFMARATGLPARLVTGYQGGEFNDAAGYLSIYQYMAHAWVEVWYDSRGWVRYDPTAMIAPERVQQGFDAYFEPQETYLQGSPFSLLRLKQFPFLNELRLGFASIDYFWSVWVLGFDTDKQQSVLSDILGEVSQTKLAIFVCLCIGVIGLGIAFSSGLIQFRRGRDRHLNAYLAVCDMLARQHLSRRIDEGPVDFCARVSQALPEIGSDFCRLTDDYIAIKYQPLTKGTHRRVSRRLIRQSMRIRLNILKLRLAVNKTNT